MNKWLLSVLFCVVPIISNAQTLTYVFDPAETYVTWSVKFMGFSSIEGKFNNIHGKLTVNQKNPQQSFVSVSIQSISLQTANKQIQQILLGKQFFDAQNYPEVKFESDGMDSKSKQIQIVQGVLSVRDITNPVDLMMNLKLNQDLAHFLEGHPLEFLAETSLNRAEFNMKGYEPFVGDVVHITIHARVLPEEEKK